MPEADPALRDVVIVPVRNEAERLHAALAALAAQTRIDGAPLDPASYEILLLANNCDDDSADVARRFARCHPAVRLHLVETWLDATQANIGYVRRLLMDAACRRLEVRQRTQGLIASTDGDTRVAPDWLAAMRKERDRGADAIGGRILTDDSVRPTAPALRSRRLDLAHSLWRARLESLLDPEPIDIWPRHHQHFGASLGVTANAYRRSGGVPAVEYLEDEALYGALRLADLRVRHSPSVRVVTSSRLDGRAPVGLAWQLRQWTDGAIHDSRVQSPSRFAALLRARALLRRCRALGRTEPAWASCPDWKRHEEALGLAPATLVRLSAEADTLGGAFAALERCTHEAAKDAGMPMSSAIVELRSLAGAAGPQALANTSHR